MAPQRKDKEKRKDVADSSEHAPIIPDPWNLGRLVQTSKEKKLLLAFRNKTITRPKYDNMYTFSANSFGFTSLFHFQGLGVVTATCGPFYPDLGNKSYCNLFIEPDYVVKSFVKGKDILC